MHFATEAELRSWPIDLRLSDLFTGDWLVDSDGVEWSMNATGASDVSFWSRLRHLSRRDQYRTAEVEYKRIGTLSLQDIKDRTLAQIDRDPGDVMMQFEDEDELRAGVTHAGGIRELIEYLGKALGDEAGQ